MTITTWNLAPKTIIYLLEIEIMISRTKRSMEYNSGVRKKHTQRRKLNIGLTTETKSCSKSSDGGMSSNVVKMLSLQNQKVYTLFLEQYSSKYKSQKRDSVLTLPNPHQRVEFA